MESDGDRIIESMTIDAVNNVVITSVIWVCHNETVY